MRLEPRAFYRLTLGELRAMLQGHANARRARSREMKAAMSWLLVGQGYEVDVVREKFLGETVGPEMDEEERKRLKFEKMMKKIAKTG